LILKQALNRNALNLSAPNCLNIKQACVHIKIPLYSILELWDWFFFKLYTMKNVLSSLLLFLFFSICVKAQNLVLNPSFENYSSCPSSGQISVVSGVINPSLASPDYFNSCTTNTNYTTPQSIYGYQTPRTGNAYIGMYTFLDAPGDICEYIQCQLSSTLSSGEYYCVRFYANIADSSLFLSSDIGVFLSSNPIFNNSSSVFTINPNYSNTIAFDKNSWKEVAFSFLSSGGEKFLTIGNFKTAAQTQTTLSQGASWVSGSYLLIDDVSVTAGNCVTTNLVDRNETDQLVIPNPILGGIVSLKFSGEMADVKDIKVYDSVGKEVFPERIVYQHEVRIDLSSYTSGIYFIVSSSKHFNSKKIITITN